MKKLRSQKVAALDDIHSDPQPSTSSGASEAVETRSSRRKVAVAEKTPISGTQPNKMSKSEPVNTDEGSETVVEPRRSRRNVAVAEKKPTSGSEPNKISKSETVDTAKDSEAVVEPRRSRRNVAVAEKEPTKISKSETVNTAKSSEAVMETRSGKKVAVAEKEAIPDTIPNQISKRKTTAKGKQLGKVRAPAVPLQEMDLSVLLPPEIVEEIFSYLEYKDLIASSEVNIGWYKLAGNERLWRCFVVHEKACWLNRYGSEEFNAITSNFSDKSSGLNEILASDTLMPVNCFKNALRQRNILKYNWCNGIFQSHTLNPKSCGLKTFDRIEVIYPSLAQQDCLYHPVVGIGENGEEGLYLIRLDAEPRIVYKLKENISGFDVEVACVMRDCVVWVVGGLVQCLSLLDGLENSKVQTIGTVGECDYVFLSMDIDNIIAWSHAWLYIWDKKTLELQLQRDSSPDTTISNVCLNHGLIIISVFKSKEELSTIEVADIKSNIETLYYFEADGRVIDVMCSFDYILFQFNCDGYDRLEARDKKTSEVIFSKSFTGGVYEGDLTHVFENLFIYRSRYEGLVQFEIDKPDGACIRHVSEFEEVKSLFDLGVFIGINTLFGTNNVEVLVYDWVKQVNIDVQSLSFTMFHISESRIVAIDEEGVLRVIAYG